MKLGLAVLLLVLSGRSAPSANPVCGTRTAMGVTPALPEAVQPRMAWWPVMAGRSRTSDGSRSAPKGPARPAVRRKPVKPTKPARSARSAKPVKPAPARKATPQRTVKPNPSKPPMIPIPPVETIEEEPVPKATPAFTEMDLPTENQLIFSRKDGKAFFQPTFSGRMISAMFGYVRDLGPKGRFTRFHEGVDIRPMERDDGGEPSDVVHAAGPGRVVHVCARKSGSNYGKYVVVEHDLFGPPFYTLYAHLASVEEGLEAGREVKRGERLGILGRTSNQVDIDQEHAHLHFEVNLMVNPRYIEWSKQRGEGKPKHGLYNGANLIGVDPVRFFQFLQYNPDLGIGDFVKREPVGFRLLVPSMRDLPWIQRHPFALTGPVGTDVAAYEISMTNYGLPIRVTPRSDAQLSEGAREALRRGLYPLTYVNGPEMRKGVCPLLYNRGTRWGLAPKGREWVEQLAY